MIASLVISVFLLAQTFEVNPQVGFPGDSFVFVDTSKNFEDGEVRKWSFGDGSLSEGVHVFHKYEKPGVYDVSLRIGDREEKKVAAVRVREYPEISFTLSEKTIGVGRSVKFTDTSVSEPGVTENFSYWSFTGTKSVVRGREGIASFNSVGAKEITLRKSLRIQYEDMPVPIFKEVVEKKTVQVIGDSVFVDSANVSVSDGLTWETAFNDLQSAIDFASANRIYIVRVSKNPVVLGKSNKGYGLIVPKDVMVVGGQDRAARPEELASGERTEIVVSDSLARDRSFRYVVGLEGVMNGFTVPSRNDAVSSYGSVDFKKGSSLIGSKIVMRSDGVGRKSVVSLNMAGITGVHVSGLEITGAGGYGKSGGMLLVSECSNVLINGSKIFGNKMAAETDGFMVRLRNARHTRISGTRFDSNDFGKRDAGCIDSESNVFSDSLDTIQIERCDFVSNISGSAPALRFREVGGRSFPVEVTSCVFARNVSNGSPSSVAALSFVSSKASVTNCLFFNNLGFLGNSLYASGKQVEVSFCTFAGISDLTIKTPEIRSDGKGLSVTNSILYTKGRVLSRGTARYDTCVVYPASSGIQGDNCVTADPMFVNERLDDFRLSEGSVAIDAASSARERDIRGAPRKSPDIGCFEYGSNAPFWTDSDTNGRGMKKEDAVVLKTVIEEIDKFNNTSGTIPMEVAPEMRRLVEDSLAGK